MQPWGPGWWQEGATSESPHQGFSPPPTLYHGQQLSALPARARLQTVRVTWEDKHSGAQTGGFQVHKTQEGEGWAPVASALLARANRKPPVQEKAQQGGPTQAPVLAQRLCAASGVVVAQQPHSQAAGVRLPTWPQGLLTPAGSWETPREAPGAHPPLRPVGHL